MVEHLKGELSAALENYSKQESSLQATLKEYEDEYEILANIKEKLIVNHDSLEKKVADLEMSRIKMQSIIDENKLVIESKGQRVNTLNEEILDLKAQLTAECTKLSEISLENVKYSVENRDQQQRLEKLATEVIEIERKHSTQFSELQLKYSGELDILREQIQTLRASGTEKDMLIMEMNSKFDRETSMRIQLEEKVKIFDRKEMIEADQLKLKSERIMELDAEVTKLTVTQLQHEQEISSLSEKLSSGERVAQSNLAAARTEIDLLTTKLDVQLKCIAALEKEIDARHLLLLEEKNQSLDKIRELEDNVKTLQRRIKEADLNYGCQEEEHAKEKGHLTDTICRLEEELRSKEEFQAKLRARIDYAEKKLSSDIVEEKEKARRVAVEHELKVKNNEISRLQMELTKVSMDHTASEEFWATSLADMKQQYSLLEESLKDAISSSFSKDMDETNKSTLSVHNDLSEQLMTVIKRSTEAIVTSMNGALGMPNAQVSRAFTPSDAVQTKTVNIPTMTLNVKKVVCKDGIRPNVSPNIELEFGEWKEMGDNSKRTNDELIMGGRTIRWFEWDDLGYTLRFPKQALQKQPFVVRIFDGCEKRFIGQAIISLVTAFEKTMPQTEVPITADIKCMDGNKMGQIIIFLSFDVVEVSVVEQTDLNTSESSSLFHDEDFTGPDADIVNTYIRRQNELFSLIRTLVNNFNAIHESVSSTCSSCADIWGKDIKDVSGVDSVDCPGDLLDRKNTYDQTVGISLHTICTKLSLMKMQYEAQKKKYFESKLDEMFI